MLLGKQAVEERGWVEVPGVRLHEGMFAAPVRGRSMEPRIPESSLAVFRANPIGESIDDFSTARVVLVILRGPEGKGVSGIYVVRHYRTGNGETRGDGQRREQVVLEALNTEVPNIEIGSKESSVAVIATSVTVLGRTRGSNESRNS